MDFRVLGACLFLHFCCLTAEFAVKDCTTKHHRGAFYPCGDNKCCCDRNLSVATCQDYDKRLWYIPPLPSYIKRLLFQSNYLPLVSRNTFENVNASHLSELLLKNDSIVNITQDAFSYLTGINSLDLSQNKNLNVTMLSNAFQYLPKRQKLTLILTNMGWSNISENLFENLYDKNVIRIDVSRNSFHRLNIDVFSKLSSLYALIATENKIHYIVATLPHVLEYLDLSLNMLQVGCCPTPFCRKVENMTLFPNLKKLHLQANIFHDISAMRLNCLDRLQYLDLSRNIISSFRTNAFSELKSLKDLRLSNMNSRIKEIQRSAFNNTRMERLRLDGGAIKFAPSRSKAISYTMFVDCPNLKELVLSNNNFYDMTDTAMFKMFSPLKKLTNLTIERAHFRLVDGFLDLLPNLIYLNLNFNHYDIGSVGVSFKQTKHLKTVSLQGNAIFVVKEESFNGLTMGSIERLNLADNPFECSCNMLWFRNAVSDDGKIGNITLPLWPSRYTCWKSNKKPLEKPQQFSAYKPTKYSCQNQLLIALISVSSFMVISTVIAIVVYKYRWYLAYWIYKTRTRRVPPEQRPLLDADGAATVEGVTYNGYVIYDATDADFVHRTFRLLMEEKFGYRMHIWERDAPVGVSNVTIVADVIYASENVVAVISEDVLENNWLQFQISIALDRQLELKREFLILVILENINYSKLSKFWCVMLTRLMSTRWCADENNVKRRVFEQQISQHFGKSHDETV